MYKVTCRIRGAYSAVRRDSSPNIKFIPGSIVQVCRHIHNLSGSIVYNHRIIYLATSGVFHTASIAMSAPGGAPSPAPRGGSMGPGANGGSMPMSQQQMSGQTVHSAPPPGHPPPQSGAMSQQNLNQIVSYISCFLPRCMPCILSRGMVILLPWFCLLHFGCLSSWESGDEFQLGPSCCQRPLAPAGEELFQPEMGGGDIRSITKRSSR